MIMQYFIQELFELSNKIQDMEYDDGGGAGGSGGNGDLHYTWMAESFHQTQPKRNRTKHYQNNLYFRWDVSTNESPNQVPILIFFPLTANVEKCVQFQKHNISATSERDCYSQKCWFPTCPRFSVGDDSSNGRGQKSKLKQEMSTLHSMIQVWCLYAEIWH